MSGADGGPRGWGFETRAIHAGQEPDPATGAVNVPVFLSSTFAQDEVGKDRGYEYGRTGNPTRTALERCVANLEGARYGRAFASGLAAEDAILRMLGPGDVAHIPTNEVHGTYNVSGESLVFVAVLSPARCSGPMAVDVSDEEPWRSLRPPS